MVRPSTTADFNTTAPGGRKRLWQFAFAMGLWSVMLVVAGPTAGGERLSDLIGGDFLAFYTAGHLVQTGQIDQLYCVESARRFQQALSETVPIARQGTAPWWNPPQFALPFALLAGLDFQTALTLWMGVLLVCGMTGLLLLRQMIPARDRALLIAMVLVAPVTSQALAHGQSTPVSLLILAATCLLATRQRFALAGLVLSFLWYKPQLAAVVTVALAMVGKRQALLGLTLGASVQLMLVLALVPSALAGFILDMPPALRAFQSDGRYDWHRHVTALAFFRQLIQGDSVGPTWPVVMILKELVAVGVAIALLAFARTWARSNHHDPRPMLALSILATPVIVPFYFDYDLLTLAVPAVLLARLHHDRLLTLGPSVLVCGAALIFIGSIDQSALYSLGPDALGHFNLRSLLLGVLVVLTIRQAFGSVASPVSRPSTTWAFESSRSR